MKRDFYEIFSFTHLHSLALEGNKSPMEGFVFFFPFAHSKIKKENHVKGLRTVKYVYLHLFFIKIAARQQKQLQEHKALYHIINSYSEEIAGTVKDLSPLGVLKTAILLHQRQLRERGYRYSGETGISFSMQHACCPFKSQKRAKFLYTVVGFQMKMKIEEGSLKRQPSLSSANVCIVFGQQSNRALSVIFVEAFLKNFYRW